MFERESHREKIMEARLRELKLKNKVKTGMYIPDEAAEEADRLQLEGAAIKAAEEEFYRVIENESNMPEPNGININNLI